jgi:hypothetical protein
VLDTLKLSLTEYSVNDSCALIVQPSAIDMRTGEALSNHPLWRQGSQIVEGAKAYFNDERFNVSIVPISHQEPDAMSCTVQFSVPKVANGSNYHPLQPREAREAVKEVERDLRRIGISTNIETARVSRLDTFKNVVAEEPFACYHPMFALLNGKRMQKRDYGTTFLWHNTQQELCIYDKLAEMAHLKADVRRLPANTIRFEHRLLKSRKVTETLGGIRTVHDLFSGYDVLPRVFEKAMRENVFSYDVAQVEAIITSELERDMAHFREHSGRNWMQQYLKAFGLFHLLQRTEIETVKRIVDKLSDDRTKAWRVHKDLEKLRMDGAALRVVGRSRRTVGTLYRELRSKVLDQLEAAA